MKTANQLSTLFKRTSEMFGVGKKTLITEQLIASLAAAAKESL